MIRSHGSIQKIAIVRDQHQRSGIILQITFQPVARFQIQMIGRFVEEKQAGLLQQQLGQCDAHLPSAAELLARAIQVLAREAKALKHGSRLCFQWNILHEVETGGTDTE